MTSRLCNLVYVVLPPMLALGGGCGVATEQYDARVAELRQAEDHLKECSAWSEKDKAGLKESRQGLDEMRVRVRELEHQRAELGLDDEAGRAAWQRSRQKADEDRRVATSRTALKGQLGKGLAAEVTAGALTVEDGGWLAVVVNEEPLFAKGESSLSDKGKKVLDAVVRELKLLPPQALAVSSATSDPLKEGSPLTALNLVADRAKRVAGYFAKQGIDIGAYGGFDVVAQKQAMARTHAIAIVLLGPTERPAPAPKPLPTDKSQENASGKSNEKSGEKTAEKPAVKSQDKAAKARAASAEASDDPGL